MRSRLMCVAAVGAVALMVPAAILSCGSDDESPDAADAAPNDAARPQDATVVSVTDAHADADADAGARADADAGPTAKLIVHSRATNVIIGDGTRLRQTPVNGVAIFEDATLIDAGALDVTEITNGTDTRPMTTVATYAGVTISEVWMPSVTLRRPSTRAIFGTVAGHSDGGLAAEAPGDAGYTLDVFHGGGEYEVAVSDAGGFRVDLREPITTPYDVAVVAEDKQTGVPFRAGVVPVTLNPDGGSTAIDVVMDHRFDESLTVNLSPASTKSIFFSVFYSAPGADYIDYIGEPVTLKTTAPMLDHAPPFDTWDRWAVLEVQGPGVGTIVRKIPSGASSLAVTVPASPTMSTPAVSSVPPYPEMATDSAVYTWTANDPQATLVKIRLSQVDATSWFEWIVYAPSSRGTYKMSPLPTDLARLPFAVKDKNASVQLDTISMEKIVDPQDAYARPLGIFYLPQELSQVWAQGIVRVQ